jgi:NDP-sugar pyrophosphorylase family protein
MQINYSHELDFRGTAGALKLAEDLIHEEDFFVMNGDSLLDIELRMLMHYHRSMKATATLALAHVDDIQRYGAVGMNELGRIISFIEKRAGNREGLINGGVYVFAREVLDLIPRGQPVSLEQDILPKLIGRDLYGLPLKGYFVDIGVPADYIRLWSTPTQLLAAVDQWRHSSCSFAPRHRLDSAFLGEAPMYRLSPSSKGDAC